MSNSMIELNKQIRLKAAVIENFIPKDESKKVEQAAGWNEELQTWTISHKNYLREEMYMLIEPN
jgi:hypothetical protein